MNYLLLTVLFLATGIGDGYESQDQPERRQSVVAREQDEQKPDCLDEHLYLSLRRRVAVERRK